jgi:Cu+-exporting ATPase
MLLFLGLNDIPCLQEAAIGISINAKSELNLQAADIIMLSEDLCKMVSLIKLLKRGNQFININLFWAFLYNLTIMPIVAGAFYGLDITISPIWSSVAMSCSSIIVVAFSNLLSLFNYNYISPNQNQKKK